MTKHYLCCVCGDQDWTASGAVELVLGYPGDANFQQCGGHESCLSKLLGELSALSDDELPRRECAICHQPAGEWEDFVIEVRLSPERPRWARSHAQCFIAGTPALGTYIERGGELMP